MSANEWVCVVTPWVATVLYIYLILKLLGLLPGSTNSEDYLAPFAIALAFFALVIALLTSIPATGHYWLLPKLTTGVLWLTVLGSALVIGGAIAALRYTRVSDSDYEAIFWGFLGFGCLGLVIGLDALAIGIVQWLIDIGLRVNDWFLIVSPLVWFVAALLLVVTIIDTDDWRANLKDNEFLFKLAALAGSLLCLVFVLDMDLHRPPISDLIFRPPLVWLTLGGSVLVVVFSYLLYRPFENTASLSKEDKDTVECASLLGGFFLPGVLNSALLILYHYAK